MGYQVSRRESLQAFGTVCVAGLAGCASDSETDETKTETTAVEPPETLFTFNWAGEIEDVDSTGILQVTHDEGDQIKPGNLYIRGDRITDVEGESPNVTTSDTSWKETGGQANGDMDGEPVITSGDEITVGVYADYIVRVVWESSDGENTKVLAESDGPLSS